MALTIPNNASAPFHAHQALGMQSDIDAMVRGVSGTGVVTGCAVTAQGTPDMTVAVAAGILRVDGDTYVITASNVTIPAADGTNPRIDLVCVDARDSKTLQRGEPAATPEAPQLPASVVLLAAVYVPASVTSIAANKITDKRVFVEGRIFNPDALPKTPHAMDDEFWGTSLDAKWTILDQQSGMTVTIANDHVFLEAPASYQRRTFAIVQTAPTDAYWRVRTKVALNGATTSYMGVGLIARNSVSGRALLGMQAHYGSFGVGGVCVRTSALNTWVSETDLYEERQRVFYLELEFSIPTLTWRVSVDGVKFTQFYAEARSSFLIDSPDQIGLSIHPYASSNSANCSQCAAADWFRRVA